MPQSATVCGMSEFVDALNNLSGWGLFAFIVMCAGVQLALSGLQGVISFLRVRGKVTDA